MLVLPEPLINENSSLISIWYIKRKETIKDNFQSYRHTARLAARCENGSRGDNTIARLSYFPYLCSGDRETVISL